jgi:hypothetical protein
MRAPTKTCKIFRSESPVLMCPPALGVAILDDFGARFPLGQALSRATVHSIGNSQLSS